MTGTILRIFLVGPRGAGKSSVGRLLATKLGWEFVDLDEQIETEAGCSITEIFAKQGEPAFRDFEARLLFNNLSRDNCVIATGGGIVIKPENRTHLRRSGKVIWLLAEPEDLWRRITNDHATKGRRPSLTDQTGISEIRKLVAERADWYSEVSDFRIDTTAMSPAEVVSSILATC